MSNTITVELGGREYEIKPLPIRQADAWRERLAGPFSELVSTLQGAEDVELNNVRDLAALVQTLTGTVVDSPRLVRELLFAYAPAIGQDADYILDNAYDVEIFDAFIEVLKLAYPFGKVRAIFTNRTGQARRRTSRKSS